MINTRFEAYKIQRELQRTGRQFEFFRFQDDEFGGKKDAADPVLTLLGLYHEQSAYAAESKDDGGIVRAGRNAKIPKILCHYDSTLELLPGDFTEIGGRRFLLTAVANIQEWNIIADLSLRLQDGNQLQY